jgi:hypothetical protein
MGFVPMSPIREGDLQVSPHINLAGPINHFQPIRTKDWSIGFRMSSAMENNTASLVRKRTSQLGGCR